MARLNGMVTVSGRGIYWQLIDAGGPDVLTIAVAGQTPQSLKELLRAATVPARSLEVCAFVERNIQDANEKSVWPDLWKKWNSENPEERYESYRGFRQAYFRNMPKVMQSYEWPSFKASPAAEKKSRELEERIRESLERYRERHGERRPEEQTPPADQ